MSESVVGEKRDRPDDDADVIDDSVNANESNKRQKMDGKSEDSGRHEEKSEENDAMVDEDIVLPSRVEYIPPQGNHPASLGWRHVVDKEYSSELVHPSALWKVYNESSVVNPADIHPGARAARCTAEVLQDMEQMPPGEGEDSDDEGYLNVLSKINPASLQTYDEVSSSSLQEVITSQGQLLHPAALGWVRFPPSLYNPEIVSPANVIPSTGYRETFKPGGVGQRNDCVCLCPKCKSFIQYDGLASAVRCAACNTVSPLMPSGRIFSYKKPNQDPVLSEDVEKWQFKHVCEFIGCFLEKNVVKEFRREKVDGKQLLAMTMRDLEQDLGLRNVSACKRVMRAIQILKTEQHSGYTNYIVRRREEEERLQRETIARRQAQQQARYDELARKRAANAALSAGNAVAPAVSGEAK